MFDNVVGVGGAISPYGQNVGATVEAVQAVASNILHGVNPDYFLSGFLAFYPQFGGTKISAAGASTAGSNQLTAVSNIANITVGMLIISPGIIPDGTTVVSVDSTHLTVTLSAQTTASGSTALACYALLVPLIVLQMYLDLANTCIQQARYRSSWQIAMALFIAHFATLWLQSTAAAGSPAAKAIAVGEARGLRTAKSVGDVSTSIDYSSIANDLDGWAAWKLTVHGQQLATLGKMVGKGGMMIR